MKKKKCVLLVEDNTGILRLLSLELRLKGYDVIQSQDGQDAIDKFKARSPDILLLDLQLPVKSGIEVLKQLRLSSKIPIIIMSSHAELAKRALDLGADAFIPKPFDPDKVIIMINNLLKE